jgi:fatty-acyl-CoA synthase
MFIRDLRRHSVECGARPCLIHWEEGGYQVLNFTQFWKLSDRMAAAISSRVNGDANVVLIVLKHQVMQLPLFVGCMKAGLIPCFLPFPSVKQDAALYWKAHEELITRIRPALVITYAEILEGMTAILGKLAGTIVEIAELMEHPTDWCKLDVHENDVALLQHSSGTTGLKKGVVLTYKEIERQTSAYASASRLDSRSIVVSWLPYYHDMGLFTAFLMPLSVGAAIVSIDAFEWVSRPTLLLELIQRFRGTHSWMPNFAFNHIVNSAPHDETYDLTSLRALVNCAEPVKAPTLEKFLSQFENFGVARSKLKACYGMAEACFAVSQSEIDEECQIAWYDTDRLERFALAVRRRPGSPGARPYVSNGTAIAGVDMRIMRVHPSSECESSVGVPVGEIAVHGEFIFKGYFRNEEATREAFVGDWYRTGDIGFIDEGQLFISGRKKDELIIHGRNYYAHDIEEVVSEISGVIPGRIVAIGVFDDATGTEEAVILSETDVVEAMHAELRREIKRTVYGAFELTPQKVGFVSRGWLVKTTSGKISRSENFQRYLTLIRNGNSK